MKRSKDTTEDAVHRRSALFTTWAPGSVLLGLIAALFGLVVVIPRVESVQKDVNLDEIIVASYGPGIHLLAPTGFEQAVRSRLLTPGLMTRNLVFVVPDITRSGIPVEVQKVCDVAVGQSISDVTIICDGTELRHR